MWSKWLPVADCYFELCTVLHYSTNALSLTPLKYCTQLILDLKTQSRHNSDRCCTPTFAQVVHVIWKQTCLHCQILSSQLFYSIRYRSLKNSTRKSVIQRNMLVSLACMNYQRPYSKLLKNSSFHAHAVSLDYTPHSYSPPQRSYQRCTMDYHPQSCAYTRYNISSSS